MSRYERIVFCQGDDADEPLQILDNEGLVRAIEYLAQWHFPGEHETSNEPSAGTDDCIYEDDNGYILT